jgi:hypothetical protein
MNDYLVQAIRSLKPNSEFSMIDNDYSTITWYVIEGKPPTQTEINAKIAKLQADEIAQNANIATSKAAILDRLGITYEELTSLLA